MKRKKRGKVPEWIKRERAARRLLEIEQGGKKDHGKVHLTDKKDLSERESNTVREIEE